MQQALAVLPELAGQLPHSVRLSASHWMQETQERWEQLAVQGWVAAQQELDFLLRLFRCERVGSFLHCAARLELQVICPLVIEKCRTGFSIDRLALEQDRRHKVHLLLVRGQDLVSTIVSFTHDARHLFVDTTRCFLRVVLRIAVVAAQEHFVVGLAEYLNAQIGAHAVVRDHRTCHLRCAFKVVRSAGGDVFAEDLFRHTTTQEHGQLIAHFVTRIEYLVLIWNGKGVTQRATTRDDRDLVNWIGVGKQVSTSAWPDSW